MGGWGGWGGWEGVKLLLRCFAEPLPKQSLEFKIAVSNEIEI